MKKIEKCWQSVWKNILENPDGSINKEQLKKELMDYSDLIGRMTELTCFLTKDKLSYPTYTVDTIISVYQEAEEERIEQQKLDDKEDGICSLCEREFDES